MAAASLPLLCFDEIFRNLGDDRHTLHSLIFVNRHWSLYAVGPLWRGAFPFHDQTRELLCVRTLLKCVGFDSSSGTADKQTMFPYTDLVSTLDLEAIDEATRILLAAEMGNTSFTRESLVATLCHRIVNRDVQNVLNLYIDFKTPLIPRSPWMTDKREYSWTNSDFDFFKFPNAPISLMKTHHLTICHESAPYHLQLAANLCKGLEHLEIVIYQDTGLVWGESCDLAPLTLAIPIISSFRQLKTLTLTSGRNMKRYLVGADHLLRLLGPHLPESLMNLDVDVNLDFSPGSLRHFFQFLGPRLHRISFTRSHCISDEHLKVFAEYGVSMLHELRLNAARDCTRKVFQEVEHKIPEIQIEHFTERFGDQYTCEEYGSEMEFG